MVIIGLLSIAVVGVMMVLAVMLVSLSLPARPPVETVTPPGLVLEPPTLSPPTLTPGPPFPGKVSFVPEEPIKGFSSCEWAGFRGMVRTDNGQASERVQVVVWGAGGSLLELDTSAADGSYELKFAKESSARKLWIQLYQNDVPVSMPISLEIQVDCQHGFQIYQVDWRAVEEQ